MITGWRLSAAQPLSLRPAPCMQAIGQPALGDRRQDLHQQAAAHEAAAQAAAASGNVEASARLILQALDCERRAGSVGPQVLQLIKPRG